MAAIKMIRKNIMASRMDALNEAAEEAERIQRCLQREIIIMKLVDHPNIMKLYDVWETPNEIFLILEHVQGGELFTHLCENGRLPTSEALDYFQQIIAAIDYCHGFNIAHRDLKPENILLDEQYNIKIADFGLAAWQSAKGLTTSCGSPHYAAPEVVSGQTYNGSAADVWSCGVILYSMLVGKLPFDDDDSMDLLRQVRFVEPEIPEDIPTSAQDLIRKMLAKKAKQRITMTGIQKHPFFLSQKRKDSRHFPPSLKDIGQPVSSRDLIDEEILGNLQTLWHGTGNDALMDSLTDNEMNAQKGVYHLLVEYQKRSQTEHDEQEEIARVARLHRKKSARKPRTPENLSPSQSMLPPRDGPPTPRRASRQAPSSSSEQSVRNHLQTVYKQNSSGSSPGPSYLAPLAVPEHQDRAIQAFFNQVADHLNALHARTGSLVGESPNLALISDILGEHTKHHNNSRAPPSTPVDPPQHGDLGRQGDGHLEVPQGPAGLGIVGNPGGTRPLSVRRKTRPERPTIDTGDKENHRETYLSANTDVVKKSSLKKSEGKNARTADRRVHIVEPPKRARSRLRKKRMPSSTSSTSSAFSSSPLTPLPVSPKTWLSSMFRFKSSTFTLLSTYDAHTTRNECRRLLMTMDVSVMLQDAEGLGVLKCRLDEFKDPRGIVSVLKAVKFKVELHRFNCEYGDAISLLLVHEKGSMESFKEVYKRLTREWVLDGGEISEAVIPIPSQGRRFSVQV